MEKRAAKEMHRQQQLASAAHAIHNHIINLPFKERVRYCWVVMTKKPLLIIRK